jgi:hypothetical protein
MLLFLIAGSPGIGLRAQAKSLAVKVENNALQISTRPLHFLSDKELVKLHNGLTVILVMDLTVLPENSPNPLYRALERFAFSYDLWEEKYSVYRTPPDGRYRSHLSATEAEQWCFKSMSVPLDIIPNRNAFMVRLECFIEEKNEETDSRDTSGLTMADIIEYFSRKKSESPHRWTMSSGYLRRDVLLRNSP